MFSLISGFCKWYNSKKEVFLLIVGLDNAGKTTFLEQMKGVFNNTPVRALDRIPPTVGLNVATVEIDDIRVVIWDVGGHKSMRSMWSKYYRDCHGVIFLVDSSDPDRFKEVKDELRDLAANTDLEDLPILICANKQDLAEAVDPEVIRNVLGNVIAEHKHTHAFRFQGTSALTCEGIRTGVTWIVGRAEQTSRAKSAPSN